MTIILSIGFVKILLVLIFLSIGNVSSSLLSRFRNRHEYIPNADLEVIRNLDDKTYDDLMNEVPALRELLKVGRRDDSVEVNASASPYTYTESEGEDEPYIYLPPSPAAFDELSTTTTPRQSTRCHNVTTERFVDVPTRTPEHPYRTLWPTFKYRTTKTTPAIRPGLHVMRADEYPHVFSCYWCGLNDTLIPNNSLCHDVFQSPEYRLFGLGRFFRAHCHFNDTRHSTQERMNHTYPHYFEYANDEGLKLKVIGPFMKGCFKRFVDVGTMYTARGCRGLYHPWRSYTRSFASHRLAKLEILTTGYDDVCVASPEASLTPFSRDISLFVRYHVCVCPTPYCNSNPFHLGADSFLIVLLLLLKYYLVLFDKFYINII